MIFLYQNLTCLFANDLNWMDFFTSFTTVNTFQRLNIKILFSATFENWYWLWKKYHISIFLVIVREATNSSFRLFYLSKILAYPSWLENECEHESEIREVPFWYESFLSFLIHLKKNFKWLIKSNSKLSSFTDRQSDCHFLSWLFVDILFFFSWREKKTLKIFIQKGCPSISF